MSNQMKRTADRIEQVRSWRARRGGDRHASEFIGRIARSARRSEREVGGFAEAWHACVDPATVSQSRIVSFRRGVATIAAPSASVRWTINRDLRAGLLTQLRAKSAVAITSVKVRSG